MSTFFSVVIFEEWLVEGRRGGFNRTNASNYSLSIWTGGLVFLVHFLAFLFKPVEVFEFSLTFPHNEELFSYSLGDIRI